MRTKEETSKSFGPPMKLDAVGAMKMMKLNERFKDIAFEVLDLVPEGANRTAAIRKLLEAKMTCVHAISYDTSSLVQAPSVGDAPTEEKAKAHAKNQKN